MRVLIPRRTTAHPKTLFMAPRPKQPVLPTKISLSDEALRAARY